MKETDDLIYTSHPDAAEIEFIKEELDRFNYRIVENDDHRPVNLIVKSKNGEIIGGLLGMTYWGWLDIDRFWVKEEHRQKGIGKELLRKAEEEAINRGCTRAHLYTHDFQAVDFYKKRGYEIKCELENLPGGHSKYLMIKKLG
jgi:ribosomal protein S18 acetylase RimI-like enzyme